MESSSSTSTSTSTSTRAASRKTRVYVFREFLLQKYVIENQINYLKPGDTILDVAGGKGDLSWLLCNIDGIDSIVADPRPTNHKSLLKSVKYLHENPIEIQKRSIPNLPTYQPLATLIPKLLPCYDDKNNNNRTNNNLKVPRHLQIFVTKDLVSAIHMYQTTNDVNMWIQYWNDATTTKKATATMQCQTIDDDDSNPHDNNETTAKNNNNNNNNSQILDAKEALKAILSIKLVLGFHPDQGTDPCFDLALLLKIPVCVVPCCVFPKEFPYRKLKDGTTVVKKYNQLIEYLQYKYSTTATTTSMMYKDYLQFNFTETAKNIVLYTLPNPTPPNLHPQPTKSTTNPTQPNPTKQSNE